MPLPGRLTPGKETRFLLYRRLGGLQGWSGRVQKNSPSTGIRSPDHPALNESLYQVRCSGPQCSPLLLVQFPASLFEGHLVIAGNKLTGLFGF